MFLHDIDYDKFNIANEDTLINPQHWDDEPFEVIVSNPPYSIKWEGDDNPVLINDPRFLLPVCLRQSQRLTLLLLCTLFLGLQLTVLPLLFVFPALCTVAVQKRKSENILLITTLLMQLFNFLVIFLRHFNSNLHHGA